MKNTEDEESRLPILQSSSNHSSTPRQQLHSHSRSHANSNDETDDDNDDDDDDDGKQNETSLLSEHNLLIMPLMMAQEDSLIESGSIRSRNNSVNDSNSTKQKRLKASKRKKRKHSTASSSKIAKKDTASSRRWCCYVYACPAPFVRSTLSVMNFLARVLFWCSVVATVAAIGWYSYELKNNGYVRLELFSVPYVVLSKRPHLHFLDAAPPHFLNQPSQSRKCQ